MLSMWVSSWTACYLCYLKKRCYDANLKKKVRYSFPIENYYLLQSINLSKSPSSIWVELLEARYRRYWKNQTSNHYWMLTKMMSSLISLMHRSKENNDWLLSVAVYSLCEQSQTAMRCIDFSTRSGWALTGKACCSYVGRCRYLCHPVCSRRNNKLTTLCSNPVLPANVGYFH